MPTGAGGPRRAPGPGGCVRGRSSAGLQVRVGLETPEAGAYQRRVAHMRLLGELYNYRLLDSRCARRPAGAAALPALQLGAQQRGRADCRARVEMTCAAVVLLESQEELLFCPGHAWEPPHWCAAAPPSRRPARTAFQFRQRRTSMMPPPSARAPRAARCSTRCTCCWRSGTRARRPPRAWTRRAPRSASASSACCWARAAATSARAARRAAWTASWPSCSATCWPSRRCRWTSSLTCRRAGAALPGPPARAAPQPGLKRSPASPLPTALPAGQAAAAAGRRLRREGARHAGTPFPWPPARHTGCFCQGRAALRR
jgi:hypothetical protein